MPTHDFEIISLLSQLENGSFLAEALLFPELNRLQENRSKVLENLLNSIPDFLDRLPTLEIHGRRLPREVELHQIVVDVHPPERSLNWQNPYPLTFHYVRWRGNRTFHAFVPALTIEVIGESEEDLLSLLPGNIVAELQRRGARGTLGNLIWDQRFKRLELERAVVELLVVSPKKKAESALRAPKDPSILKDVATLLVPGQLPRAYEVDEEVRRLAELLTGRQGRSVLLVGSSGVGKTAVAYELVRQKRHHHLASTPFWETTGARLMVGADSFGDWQERCRKVVTEASHTRAVLLLGNLFELAEVARHSTTPQGMAGFFRPYLERGDLLAVVECTPQQRELLERDHPHLLHSFSTLEIDKPGRQKVLSILLSSAGRDRAGLPALETIERLHTRYAGYSAYPGRPLRFLKELLAETTGEIGPEEVAAAFAEETGLPRFMVDDALPLRLGEAREFFQSRILGQSEAVTLVVDLLASVKAALAPPGKPIASLLFIGPTGVGKTEMARTLAQYLFRDRGRMVRFDMSEFADPMSVERLVGGRESGQGLLTSRVREQPFGVVLFDELEKADPSFFDLLLQILGEGRLTDAGGRVADFTNSLVVMTSNLGAASFSKGPLGFRTGGDTEEQARLQFTSAVKAAFRPELFNRIDRLVPFAPLNKETAVAVARREVARLQTRDGLRGRRLSLNVSDSMTTHLAEKGYDRRYGARPLKRAIESILLEPLARLASEAGDRELEVSVDLENGSPKFQVTVVSDSRSREREGEAETARRTLALRRRARRLVDGKPAQDLRNRLHRLVRLQHRADRGAYLSDDMKTQLAQLPAWELLERKLAEGDENARQLERDAVLSVTGYNPVTGLPARLENQGEQIDQLVLELYGTNFDRADRATLILYPEKGVEFKPLWDAYLNFWEEVGFKGSFYRLAPGRRETPEQAGDHILRLPYGEEVEDRALWCEPELPENCFKGRSVGAAVELEGPLVLPTMLGESGLHLFGADNPKACEVVVWATPLKSYPPPAGIHIPKTPVGHKRRFYNKGKGMVDDPHLDRHLLWSGKSLDQIVSDLIPAELRRVAEEACG